MNSINWTCLKTWKESAYNTLWCLVGCSIGDFGTIFYFQSIDHSLSIYLVMILAIFNGLITSVLLETFILIKKMKFIDALKTKYKKDPDEFSLLGYETGLAIATALELVNEDEMDEDALIAALDKVNVEGPRGNLSFSPELNRCLNDHHIFEVCKKEDGHALRFVETVKADEKYFYEVCNEEVSLKRGGWFNAYLCH